MGIYSRTNTGGAKVWGAGTILIGLVMLGPWGAVPAAILIAAGALVFASAGLGPSSLIKWAGLQATYWFLVIFAVGVGVS